MLQRKLLAALGFALTLVGATAAKADNVVAVSTCGGETLTAGNSFTLSQDTTGKLCVNATVSASVSGFTPGGTFATLTSTGSSASVALPAGTTVAIQNTGTTTVSCTLGIGSATALASEIQVPASSSVFVTPGSNTFGACIDQTGSASNLVVLAGGSGLGTGFGGGGGGTGGGGAITAASGSYASGAFSAGSYAAGAVVAGAFVDGWDLTQGTKADAAYAGSGSASVVALLKGIYGVAAGALPAGTNSIGTTQLPANVTATDCSGTVSTGGTAVNAFAAQTTLHGFTILNDDTSEPLWISFTTTAAAATAGSYPLAAATATTYAGANSFTSPPGFGTNHALSVVATTTGHKFSCTWW